MTATFLGPSGLNTSLKAPGATCGTPAQGRGALCPAGLLLSPDGSKLASPGVAVLSLKGAEILPWIFGIGVLLWF